MRKLGKNLKVGDTIKVWWSSYVGQRKGATDTITKIIPYTGPIQYIFNKGARLAWFQFNAVVGMTIENDAYYEIIDK